VRSLPRLLAIALFAASLCGGAAHAAVAVDNSSNASGNAASLTFPHTVNPGANRVLIVGVSLRDGATPATGVTYGGIPMTPIGTVSILNWLTRTSIYGLVAPPVGAANVVVTLGGTNRIVAGATSFTGVDQAAPWGAFTSNLGFGNAPTVAVAAVAGGMVFDTTSIYRGGIVPAAGAGQTAQWTGNDGPAASGVSGGGSTEPGGGTVTMSWAFGGAGRFWTIGAVALQPLTVRPDAMIKIAAEPAAAYLTDGVYETTAATQTKSLGVLSGTTASFNVRFDNDGGVSDDLVITGSGPVSGFTVQYLDETATDRTAAVTGGGYTIAALPPGASRVWTLLVTPSGDPAPVAGGTSYAVLVTAESAASPAAVDQVEAVTTSISANLSLAKSVDLATASPGEDLTYSVVATNGAGLGDASGIVVADPIPADTGFRIGSAVFDPGSTALTAAVSYSNDNGATWAYTPASGMCGAPAGYDDCVTDVRFTMSGSMQAGESFSVEFVARVR
jgi:uncharacterized repeat protein (TIGR01451 family)